LTGNEPEHHGPEVPLDDRGQRFLILGDLFQALKSDVAEPAKIPVNAKDVHLNSGEGEAVRAVELHSSGIFADFGDGFDKPKYYCKCPNCHYVHGHYKTPREAILKKLCPLCDSRGIEKLKKEVRDVDVRKPVRPLPPQRMWVESLVESLLA
jgi:hypothetical protein